MARRVTSCSSFLEDEQSNLLSCTNLNVYALSNGNHIVKDVTFSVKSGEVIGIMGPSGAGKTTLMSALTGLTRGLKCDGQVTLNGQLMAKEKKATRLVGFLPQHDIFNSNHSVDDHMLYASKLKLPAGVSEEDREKRITSLLRELKIDHCRHTLIRDISGGQRKRVMVAAELINRPPILVLDEPTTGLDSHVAQKLIDTLKTSAAEEKCIVVLSLHQPSSDVYSAFDRVLWVAKGHLVGNCDRQELISGLDGLGYPCPEGFMISDHMMDLCQDPIAIDEMIKNESDLIKQPQFNTDHYTVAIKQLIEHRNFPNRMQQFMTLTRRHCYNRQFTYWKNKAHVVNKLLIFFIVASVFWRTYDGPLTVMESSRNNMGALFFLTQHFAYDSYFASMPEDIHISASELRINLYGAVEFNLARIAADTLWFGLVAALDYTIIILASWHFDIDAWKAIAACLLSLAAMWIGTALSKCVSSWVRHPRKAGLIGDLFITTGSWTSGYNMAVTTMPWVVKWTRYVTHLPNIYNLYTYLTMGDVVYICEDSINDSLCDGTGTITGADFLASRGLEVPLWYSGMWLVLLIIMIEIMAMVGTKYSRVFK